MQNILLGEKYPQLLCDLDGTIYNGSEVFPIAISALHARDPDTTYFVTNNGSRTPDAVAQKLQQYGLHVSPDHIVTSAQGIALLAKEYLKPHDLIYVLGSAALCTALKNEGFDNFVTVDQIHESTDEQSYHALIEKVHHAQAVIQSLNPQTSWQNLADAAIAIHHGALWFASNNDSTLPSEQGLLLGNGAFVYVLGIAVHPKTYITAGKPDKALLEIAMRRFHKKNAPDHLSKSDFLMIGDRLDTDIAAGVNAEVDTLCVLTGVSNLVDTLRTPSTRMPTYISPNCAALAQPISDSLIQAHASWSTHWDKSHNVLYYENLTPTTAWKGVLAILAAAKNIPDEYKPTLQLQGKGDITPAISQFFGL